VLEFLRNREYDETNIVCWGLLTHDVWQGRGTMSVRAHRRCWCARGVEECAWLRSISHQSSDSNDPILGSGPWDGVGFNDDAKAINRK